MLDHGCELAQALPSRAAAWANRGALRLGTMVDAISSGDVAASADAVHHHFTRHQEVDVSA
jgi:hypothetical protein